MLGSFSGHNVGAEASGSGTQRPNSAPPSLCDHSVSRQGSCQYCSEGRAVARNSSATHASGRHSANSLASSRSFETPYGVVRQASFSTEEPVRMHSGTSQESFRRDMSVYRLHVMPMLAEDGNSSEEDDDLITYKARRKKGKGNAYTKNGKGATERRKIMVANKHACHVDKPGGCSNIFKVCFACTGHKNGINAQETRDNETVDSGMLLDVAAETDKDDLCFD